MRSHRMRGQGGDGEFRDVGVLRHEAGDAAQAEARAEPIDEMVELGGMVGCSVIGGKARLQWRATLGDRSGEAHEDNRAGAN